MFTLRIYLELSAAGFIQTQRTDKTYFLIEVNPIKLYRGNTL